MISKELLSLVLGKKVFWTETRQTIPNSIRVHYDNETLNHDYEDVNLDTLGRMCKEWCRNSDLYLISYISQLGGVCDIYTEFNEKVFHESKVKTELEAIIKATEWAAKEKGLL